MSTYMEAAEAAKNLNKMLRGVLLVGEALERVGSIEAAEEDARTKLARAQAQLFEASSELDAALQAVNGAHAQAQSIVADAKAAARRTVDAAQADASKLSADAAAQVAEVERAAKKQADQVVAQAESRRAMLEVDVERMTQAVHELDARVEASKQELEETESKLTRAREEAARIFGVK